MKTIAWFNQFDDILTMHCTNLIVYMHKILIICTVSRNKHRGSAKTNAPSK